MKRKPFSFASLSVVPLLITYSSLFLEEQLSASIWPFPVQHAVPRSMLALLFSVLRSQFSARWFLASLVSSFQVESISG